MTDPIQWDAGEKFTLDNEGRRLEPYDDSTGETVPVGAPCHGTLTVGSGHTGPDVVAGIPWTQRECDHAFMVDYASAFFRARADVGPAVFDTLDEARKAALVDMAYQMGGRGLAKFVNLIAAVQRRDWPEAVVAAQASVWARKTAKRAARVEALLETGEFPT